MNEEKSRRDEYVLTDGRTADLKTEASRRKLKMAFLLLLQLAETTAKREHAKTARVASVNWTVSSATVIWRRLLVPRVPTVRFSVPLFIQLL